MLSPVSREKTRSHPFYVTPRARHAIERVIERALGGTWSVAGLTRRDASSVALDLRGPEDRGLRLGLAEGRGHRSLVQGEVYAASFEHLEPDDDTTRRAAERACRAFASLKSRGLLTENGIEPPRAERIAVHLEADEMGRWLQALLPDEVPLDGGWRVHDVRSAPDGGVLASLAARDSAAGERAIEAWITAPREDALYTSEQLSISYAPGVERAPSDSVAARVIFELGMRIESIEGAVEVRPSRGRRLRVSDARGELTSFQVSVGGACGQACAFCCLDSAARRADSDPDATPFLDGIRDAAGRGARLLRVNGIEPLRAPYVVELLEEAQRCGFTRVELKSSCRPLADPALAARVLGALRVSHRIDVPIYGSTAAVHDRVVGARGAFDEVMAAFDNIRASLGPAGELRIETVVVPDNIGDLQALGALAARLGAPLGLQLPHPTGTEAPSVYPRVAMSFATVMAAAFPADGEPPGELLWGQLPVCAELAHERRTGTRSLTLARFERRAAGLSGALYESDAIDFASADGNRVAMSVTTPCPHAGECYAAPACPAAVYALYAQTLGLSELAPIARDDLADHEAALLEGIDALERS